MSSPQILSDRKIAKNRINVLKTDEKNAPNRYLVHSGIEKQLKHTGSSPCRSDRGTPCTAPCNCIISALYVFVKGARKRTCLPLTNAYSVLFCCRGAGHAQAKGEWKADSQTGDGGGGALCAECRRRLCGWRPCAARPA